MDVITNILHYIQQHFDQELSLEKLAAEAHYSPYHFHRLFKQQVGEPPLQYLIRLRLEKATKELLFYPGKSIFAIAVDCGFRSQSVFARAFKARYQLSAEQYRRQAIKTIQERTDALTMDVRQYPVTVTRLQHFTIACDMVLLHDEQNIMNTFKLLHRWAAARQLIGKHPEYYGVLLDSPFSTPLDKCRYLAGIRITKPAEGRECRTLGGMTIAQIPVLGNYEVLTDYALYVKKRWMQESGYAIVQGIPGFEHFAGMDFNKPYAQHYRTICIGIKPE